jgi:hypothetical protein
MTVSKLDEFNASDLEEDDDDDDDKTMDSDDIDEDDTVSMLNYY